MIKFFVALLQVAFILLKVLGVSAVATWSWWLVLSPLVVSGLFIVGVWVVTLVVFGVSTYLSRKVKW